MILDNDKAEQDKKISIPNWLLATDKNIEDLDFEAPIFGCKSADCNDLSSLFRKASEYHEHLGGKDAEISALVFAMLAAVTNFHFKPHDRGHPFGAMMSFESGRTAIPEDFRGSPVASLATGAALALNPVLKARLCDVCWLLERNRHELGRLAINAYLDIVDNLESGEFEDLLDKDSPEIRLTSRDSLLRALTIGSRFNETPEMERAKEKLVRLRSIALAAADPVPVLWFYDMDLDFGVSDVSVLATELVAFASELEGDGKAYIVVDLWRLAARAYHYLKDEDSENRCRLAGAEILVCEAEKHESAMQASHWLSNAIAEISNVPKTRERRSELRHKLIDLQASIPDEMSTFSQDIDLRGIVKALKDQLNEKRELIDLLLLFADLGRSPQPEQLVNSALEKIRKYPLSSLFGTSFHDREGKAIYRSNGGDIGGQTNENSVHIAVLQDEDVRRMIFVNSNIKVARQHIMDNFHIGEDVFHAFLSHSPFIPNDLLHTYSRGFQRFFEADYVSALYILTPMLENSLRHVLKSSGHDVTNFDGAQQVQQDMTISAIFDRMRRELEGIFGPAAVADVDRVFLLRPGPTIRHEVAHGLLHDGSPYSHDAIYACWLIFRLCSIPLFKEGNKIVLPV